MKTRLHSIEGPYFCVCVVSDVKTKKIVKEAPVMRYVHGWDVKQLKAYCKTKKWTYLELCELPSATTPLTEDVTVHVTEH